MDGIAVSAGSTPCPADDAGRWRLAASAFTWVDTGDPLPAGMDTVVERERVQLSADGSALITGLAPRGPHVRATGEDFQAGQLLIPAGHRLRPADLAAAAAVRRAALAADIVLVVAGSSAGRSDHTVAILAQAGGLAVRGVAVRPGHPVLLGYARQGRVQAREPTITVPVIGVPGYPLAAAVIFELFAVPLLAALQGGQSPDCVWQRVQLACDWTSSLRRRRLGPGVPELSPRPARMPVAPPWPRRIGEAPGRSAGSCAPMPGARFPSGRENSRAASTSTSS